MKVDILTRKLNQAGNKGTVTYRDVRNNQTDEAHFWTESNNEETQASRFCLPGKTVDIEMKLQRGKSRKDGDGFWPDENFIVAASPIDGDNPFAEDEPTAQPKAIPADPTRESIERQVAAKCATELGVAHITHGEGKFDINMVTGWTADIAKAIRGAE